MAESQTPGQPESQTGRPVVWLSGCPAFTQNYHNLFNSALPTTNPVFAVVGIVKNADDTLAADGLEVVVSNETKKLTAITLLGEQESGKYGVAFVDTENKTVAAERDSLKVTVKREGDIVGSQTYNLTSEDIVKTRAIISR